MTPAPLFSVVIPTHNRVDMLRRALHSVIAQTMTEYEIVVVDDGSTDSTPTFLASVASERLTVLRNDPNRGVSASRNRGLMAASGEFLVFLDDDDEFRPYALAILKQKLMSQPQLDFVWGGRLIHQKNAERHRISTRADDWSKYTQPLSGSAFLPFVLEIATNSAFTVRRSVLANLGGFDETLKVSEDRDLFIRLARNGNLGAAVAKTIIDIDEHFNDSLSRNLGFRAGPNIDLKVIDKHREYLELPQHQRFLDSYLLVVFCGFLHAGDRRSAMRIFGELRNRGAVDSHVLRMYVRYAPEFRRLKAVLRYDPLRRLKSKILNSRIFIP